MRIGELSRRTGITRDTIRFYERQGLISAEAREGGNNYKDYGEQAQFTLEVIRDAQAAGLTIGDLSVLLSQLDASDGDAFDGDRFLAAKIAEVEARITASQRFLDLLRATRTALARAPFDDGAEPPR